VKAPLLLLAEQGGDQWLFGTQARDRAAPLKETGEAGEPHCLSVPSACSSRKWSGAGTVPKSIF